MIGFEPTEEQALILGSVTAFAKEVLRPGARAAESARGLSEAALSTARGLGLTTLELPTSLGGMGLGLLESVLVEEALGQADPAASLAFEGPHALGAVVRELGTEAQLTRWLGPFCEHEGRGRVGAFAWSEARPAAREGLGTTAVRDGGAWVLRGRKARVHQAGRAELYAVAAQVEPERGWDGLGVFLVPSDAPGLTVGPRAETLGLDAVTFADVTLDGVRVDDQARLGEGTITEGLARAFLRVALKNAARCVGLARAASEVTLGYTSERVAFGKPVAHFQSVAFTLVDRHLECEAASLLVRRAAWSWDARGCSPGEVALACSAALRAAARGADDAVQLHGGAGFMRDYLPEKLTRDARTLGLYGMTATALDQLAAASELGLPLSGAVALPTPDAQPVLV